MILMLVVMLCEWVKSGGPCTSPDSHLFGNSTRSWKGTSREMAIRTSPMAVRLFVAFRLSMLSRGSTSGSPAITSNGQRLQLK